MRYALYAVEEDTPDGPQLAERYDEHGNGSPLVWPDREGAQAFVDYAEAHDAPGEMRVVELAGETDTDACDCGVGALIGQVGGDHEKGCPARGEAGRGDA